MPKGKLVNRIVRNPLKIDFHIHSYASNYKDKNKVKNSKIANIDTLIDRINLHKVNAVSITDHNNFDYELYKILKKEEQNDKNSIKLVLPGVEFDVLLNKKDIHIITLFNDKNESKIKKIQNIIFDTTNNKPNSNNKKFFTESEYFEVLRKIDLDVILIAHQKESLGSKKKRQHDINTIGEEYLKKLLFIDYFQAYEFNNINNELYNKNYITYKEPAFKNMKFIIGSDNHD